MLTDYDAVAYIKGGEEYPNITGTVGFKGVKGGTWVDADISGLPEFRAATDDSVQIGPHGFHIHNGNCSGSNFENIGTHLNPDNRPHGDHMGDLPALFSNHGRAKMLVFTDKFTPDMVIGRNVVIHSSPDDYMTQPSGNSGKPIACGMIEKVE